MARRIDSHIFVRFIIIGIWLACIIIFLYGPQYMQTWRTNKTITILAWPTAIDAEFLNDFEQETGIKVHINYYENNEEMLVKLQTTSNAGYDLIMPSDYAVSLLREKKLIKKIDKTKLSFIQEIEPFFHGMYYDPTDEYTIPFGWGVFGIGINTLSLSTNKEIGWDIVFDPLYNPRSYVSMPDDAREDSMLAAYYLFGYMNHLDARQVEAVKRLLIEQKKWVASYTDLRADYLLISQAVPIAVTLSTEISKALEDYSFIDFIIPKEGTFAVIDILALPATSNNELVYQFLNYLYTPSVLQKYIDKHGFLPVLKTVKQQPIFNSIGSLENLFSKCHFFIPAFSEATLRDIWITLKA